jgi:hypothetical protein
MMKVLRCLAVFSEMFCRCPIKVLTIAVVAIAFPPFRLFTVCSSFWMSNPPGRNSECDNAKFTESLSGTLDDSHLVLSRTYGLRAGTSTEVPRDSIVSLLYHVGDPGQCHVSGFSCRTKRFRKMGDVIAWANLG